MSVETELFNVRVNRDLKRDFFNICKNYNVSMSSRVNDFIREFCEENRNKLIEEKIIKDSKWEVGKKKWREKLKKYDFKDFREDLGW